MLLGRHLLDRLLKVWRCWVSMVPHNALSIHHKGIWDTRHPCRCHEDLSRAPAWIHYNLQMGHLFIMLLP